MTATRETEAHSADQALLEQLTLEEKVGMLAGVDMWTTPGIPRLGVPGLKVSDGPAGARGASFTGKQTAASVPCGTALGATWNPELVEQVGALLGEEARTKGAHVLLAPTVNIHRSPLAGRNFECYSEDPLLTARIAVGFIRGVQSTGVGACIKHFVCNDSEYQRHTISSDVGERALREIYLRPFEVAVAEARPWSLMSSYNKINGTWASENDRLLNRILRDEWSFDGFVVSDWFGTNSTAPVANGGLDLEMPGPARHLGEKLLDAVKQGEVSEEVVDDKVRRLLLATRRVGAKESAEPMAERAEDRPEHRAVARRAAGEAMVLLKNEPATLPLDAGNLKRLAVIGPNAHPAIIQGGGSARVTPHYSVSPLDGIRARCADAVEVAHAVGCTNHKSLPPIDARMLEQVDGTDSGLWRVDFFAGLELAGDPVLSRTARRVEYSWFGAPAKGVDPQQFSVRASGVFVPPETGTYTLGIASAGKARVLVDGELVVDNWSQWERGDTFYGAGSTERTATIEMRAGERRGIEIEYSKDGAPLAGGFRLGLLLPVPEDAMERAEACAREADAAIVVVGLNSDWESEGHDRADLELPGRQVELIERIAAANPRTVVVMNAGAPVRVEDWIDGVPALLQAWYPGQECGNALADVLFGDVDASGRLPTSFPRRIEDTPAFLNYPGENGHVLYGEGVFVGYRYYDSRCVEPRFPFGHGLSYAQFEYSGLQLDRSEIGPGEGALARVTVRNTGARDGVEVVQLYVHDREASVARPEQELRGFEKIALAAGESRTVELPIEAGALAFWDPEEAGWRAEPGEFEIRVGRSSRNVRARADLRLRDA